MLNPKPPPTAAERESGTLRWGDAGSGGVAEPPAAPAAENQRGC